jgi:tRNA U34 5-methylaminomethyl-2-thiouridine-forming methyltransferase MnmC
MSNPDKRERITGDLCDYQVVHTEDGHQTLYSHYFDENFHSLAGAYDETVHNYINGCEIVLQAADTECCRIFEVGFGLGIGYQCTVDNLAQRLSEIQLQKLDFLFLSVELDPKLIEYATSQENLNHKHFPKLNQLIEYQQPVRHYSATIKNKTIIILIGDARKTLPSFCLNKNLTFDSIYQDAFSPKKNPTLWTKQWFQLLKSLSHSKTLLATYSSSSSIRKTLVESGWIISSHAGFKTKKTCTRATLHGICEFNLLKGLESEKIKVLNDQTVYNK